MVAVLHCQMETEFQLPTPAESHNQSVKIKVCLGSAEIRLPNLGLLDVVHEFAENGYLRSERYLTGLALVAVLVGVHSN